MMFMTATHSSAAHVLCDLISVCCVAAGEWLHIQRGEQTETFTHHVHLVGRTQCHRSLHIANWYIAAYIPCISTTTVWVMGCLIGAYSLKTMLRRAFRVI